MRFKLAGLTPAQVELLKQLHFAFDKQPKVHAVGLRAVDLGAESSGPPYEALSRLVEEGLCERDSRAGTTGSLTVYRITPDGVQKWGTLKMLTSISGGSVLGTQRVRDRLKTFADLCGV